ncbi:MAG: sugar ABC transporter permease [Clostridiales bacterium]|nr:sugar ABC transporter permease [Clostridiales bacterium]
MKKSVSWKTSALILPGLMGFLLFYIIPFAYSFKYALTDNPVSAVFVGLNNFRDILSKQSFVLAVKNTLKFIAVSLPLNMSIPLLLAVMIEKLDNRRRLTTVFMSPLVIPSACIAFLFRSFFSNNGLMSYFTTENINWLKTEYSFFIAVGIYIWKNMGYNLVLYLAGLSNIPADYYEWAQAEGMGKLRFFFQIKLRYLMNTLFIVFVMSFINSFKLYRELYMLAGDYPNENIYMLQHYMNNQFSRLDYADLSAAAILVTVAVAAAVVMFLIAERKSA